MKINFGTYTYFGDINKSYNNNSQYAFDKSYFNKLIGNRQYNDAADYASKYHFSDPQTQMEHENDIANLRRNGRILASIYSKIDRPQDLARVEFANSVFKDGGIESLLQSDNEETKNYAKNFMDIKRRIGSKETFDGEKLNLEEATSLSVTFEPEKRTFLGIDWLAADNENNIDNFYERSGLNQKQLETAGVRIVNKDGKTTLNFTKDNPLANQILYNVPKRVDAYAQEYGINDDILANKNVTITGYNSKGEKLGTQFDADRLQQMIDEANKTNEEFFKDPKIDNKGYSSVVGPSINDDLDALNEAYNTGQIDENTYAKEYKRVAGWIDDLVAGMGSGNYKFYSNAYNPVVTDETLHEIDNDKRGELMNFMTSVKKNRIHYLSMISNGEIGTLIVVDGASDEPHETDEVTSSYKSRRRMIFVPGLFTEEAQKKINRNSSLQAIQEYNDMLRWGYDYQFVDGSKVGVSEDGRVWSNGKEIDKDEFIKSLNKDMIKRQAVDALKYQYLNDKDEIINYNAYDQQAKNIAIKAANDISPEIPLIDKDNKPLSLDEIFMHKSVLDDEQLLNEKYIDDVQFQVYKKLNDIYDVYNFIMKGISYYKQPYSK